MTIGADGTITSFNTAAEQMFGWNAAEIVGQPATVVLPPDLRGSLDAYLANALRVDRATRRADATSRARACGATAPSSR